MTPQHECAPELRRFLVINFRAGTRENGYLVGPALVSTRDYKRLHFWDEPSAAVLSEDDYEIVKIYRLGLTYDQVTGQYAKDFPSTGTQPYSLKYTSAHRCSGTSPSRTGVVTKPSQVRAGICFARQSATNSSLNSMHLPPPALSAPAAPRSCKS